MHSGTSNLLLRSTIVSRTSYVHCPCLHVDPKKMRFFFSVRVPLASLHTPSKAGIGRVQERAGQNKEGRERRRSCEQHEVSIPTVCLYGLGAKNSHTVSLVRSTHAYFLHLILPRSYCDIIRCFHFIFRRMMRRNPHHRLAEAARASEAVQKDILSRKDLEMEIGRLKGELQEVWKQLLPSCCNKLLPVTEVGSGREGLYCRFSRYRPGAGPTYFILCWRLRLELEQYIYFFQDLSMPVPPPLSLHFGSCFFSRTRRTHE